MTHFYTPYLLSNVGPIILRIHTNALLESLCWLKHICANSLYFQNITNHIACCVFVCVILTSFRWISYRPKLSTVNYFSPEVSRARPKKKFIWYIFNLSKTIGIVTEILTGHFEHTRVTLLWMLGMDWDEYQEISLLLWQIVFGWQLGN